MLQSQVASEPGGPMPEQIMWRVVKSLLQQEGAEPVNTTKGCRDKIPVKESQTNERDGART